MIAGAVMTLAIFSYLLSDNILYRWALALLVGGGTGFAFGAVLHFLLEWTLEGLQQQDVVGQVIYGLPLILGLLLLAKSWPRLSFLGNLTMGMLIGVGAAVALTGALLGTLVPQVLATELPRSASPWGWGNALLVLLGTLMALFVFSPLPAYDPVEERSRLFILWLRRVGRGFIAVALAVAFAGAITTALTMLVERLWVLATVFIKLAPLVGG